jgi:hypothetical protein
MKRWHRGLVLAVLAVTSLGAVSAQSSPGDLLALEKLGTLSPGEVDGVIGGRFRRDGETPPRAQTAVDAYLLRFTTVGPDGAPAEAIGQLFVPREPADDGLLAFAAGSTGLAASCSPTNERLTTGRLETYGATALAYAGQGLPTVLPDYLGSTDPNALQPYFVAMAEAAVVLDALRAATDALAAVAPAVEVGGAFIAGYSQGGHATFASADRAAVHAPDVPLKGVIGFGPSGDLDTLFRDFHYVAPWVVAAYEATYPGAVRARDVLSEPYASRLTDDVARLCVLGAQRYYPATAVDLFQPDFYQALTSGTLGEAFPTWRALFDQNDTGLQLDGLPVAIFQGVDDPVVPLDAQDDYVARLCAQGSPVRYANYLRTRHETRYVGFREALQWMRGRLADEPPPDDCPEVARP